MVAIRCIMLKWSVDCGLEGFCKQEGIQPLQVEPLMGFGPGLGRSVKQLW